jgi:hypothetical protein
VVPRAFLVWNPGSPRGSKGSTGGLIYNPATLRVPAPEAAGLGSSLANRLAVCAAEPGRKTEQDGTAGRKNTARRYIGRS